jgi:hypothetical protein
VVLAVIFITDTPLLYVDNLTDVDVVPTTKYNALFDKALLLKV